MRSTILVSLAVLVATACVPVPQEVPEERFEAALVDSVPWQGEMDELVLRRVEVRSDTAVDTIAGVLTARPVVSVPKTGIVGFAFDTAAGRHAKGFRYDPAKKRVHDVVLPEELMPLVAAPALSPDGRHVAYVAYRDSLARAVVRVFPRGRIVAQGPEVALPPSEFFANGARWTAPDAFEVAVGLGGPGPARHLRVRGTARGGVLAADTVATPPADAPPADARSSAPPGG